MYRPKEVTWLSLDSVIEAAESLSVSDLEKARDKLPHDSVVAAILIRLKEGLGANCSWFTGLEVQAPEFPGTLLFVRPLLHEVPRGEVFLKGLIQEVASAATVATARWWLRP